MQNTDVSHINTLSIIKLIDKRSLGCSNSLVELAFPLEYEENHKLFCGFGNGFNLSGHGDNQRLGKSFMMQRAGGEIVDLLLLILHPSPHS